MTRNNSGSFIALTNSSTIYCPTVIVCVLDVVCRAFYKQSMVQSEVRKLCVYPTKFIYSEAVVYPRRNFQLWSTECLLRSRLH